MLNLHVHTQAKGDIRNTKQKTKAIKNTTEPVFEERFVFYLPSDAIEDETCRLQLTVRLFLCVCMCVCVCVCVCVCLYVSVFAIIHKLILSNFQGVGQWRQAGSQRVHRRLLLLHG